jgi:hypothetical protein
MSEIYEIHIVFWNALTERKIVPTLLQKKRKEKDNSYYLNKGYMHILIDIVCMF